MYISEGKYTKFTHATVCKLEWEVEQSKNTKEMIKCIK